MLGSDYWIWQKWRSHGQNILQSQEALWWTLKTTLNNPQLAAVVGNSYLTLHDRKMEHYSLIGNSLHVRVHIFIYLLMNECSNVRCGERKHEHLSSGRKSYGSRSEPPIYKNKNIACTNFLLEGTYSAYYLQRNRFGPNGSGLRVNSLQIFSSVRIGEWGRKNCKHRCIIYWEILYCQTHRFFCKRGCRFDRFSVLLDIISKLIDSLTWVGYRVILIAPHVSQISSENENIQPSKNYRLY